MSDIEEAFADVSLTDPGSSSDPNPKPIDATTTIGATVPTGFEFMAAAEVKEKLSSSCRISKDRGKIYFNIPVDSLSQVHRLRSVDNLFVVVEEFADYKFKESKEAALEDLQQLVGKLPWAHALQVWQLNTSVKKKKIRHKHQNPAKSNRQEEEAAELGAGDTLAAGPEVQDGSSQESDRPESASLLQESSEEKEDNGDFMATSGKEKEADEIRHPGSPVLKFRVTCNRAGDKHSFSSNEAARDFGGTVQEHFQWKADMTNFDVEVLLNIHGNEVVVAIALTEESLHRRNITHFGPTTLRSTLAYGMLRLCDPQPTDVIVDPMCGTGAIPIEGVSEWSQCYFMAGDNNSHAVNKTANNIVSLLKKRQNKDGSCSSWGLAIDAVRWNIFNLPLRTGSVDVIVTDMPFGKRIGSKRKNWDLYPACLREMSRVCRPGTGRAVLLTHDKKCFHKALAKLGHLWRKGQTVWVNIGGLHAAVYLLTRTWTRATAHQAGPSSTEHRVSPEEEGD